MSLKKRKNFTLHENTLEKLKELALKKNMSESGIVDKAVDHFYKSREQEHQMLVKIMSNLFDEKLSNIHEILNKVWVTGNVIDRDTKMILEFWNHYFFVNDFDAFATTEKYRTSELSEAGNLVKKRIAENRQRKLEWEEKRKNNEMES